MMINNPHYICEVSVNRKNFIEMNWSFLGNHRDHLTMFYKSPVQGEIPVDAKDVFVQMISEGEKPSKSLREVQAKYLVPSLDHSITFALLRAAFPNIDLMDEALSSRIIDSDYPNHTDSLTDQEFDEIIERIKDGSDSW